MRSIPKLTLLACVLATAGCATYDPYYGYGAPVYGAPPGTVVYDRPVAAVPADQYGVVESIDLYRAGGGSSVCIDLTPALARMDHPRHLRGDRLTVHLLPSCANPEANVSNIRPRRVEVVALMGGLPGVSSAVTGEELVRELAGRLGGTCRYLHGPALLRSREVRDAVVAEPSIGASLSTI